MVEGQTRSTLAVASACRTAILRHIAPDGTSWQVPFSLSTLIGNINSVANRDLGFEEPRSYSDESADLRTLRVSARAGGGPFRRVRSARTGVVARQALAVIAGADVGAPLY